jgi:triacylglycerol lipase
VTEQLPPDVIAQLTALDSEITPDLVAGTWAILKPYHEKNGYTAPKIARDLRYGNHERHRLDVHTSGEQAGAPVFVFVHGGGFIGGDKHVPGSPAYDFLGAWAGVTITYRLAPEHTWPCGAQDVASAIAWIRDNIADYGGDPDRIVVAGNSAGAVHVASYVTGQGSAGQDSGSLDGVRGAAMLSGFYRVPLDERGDLERAYYGDTLAEDTNTLDALTQAEIPLLFSVAERDPLFFQTQAARLVAAWFIAHRSTPNLVWVAGHNHISGIGSVGVDDAALGAPLARFINRVTA